MTEDSPYLVELRRVRGGWIWTIYWKAGCGGWAAIESSAWAGKEDAEAPYPDFLKAARAARKRMKALDRADRKAARGG